MPEVRVQERDRTMVERAKPAMLTSSSAIESATLRNVTVEFRDTTTGEPKRVIDDLTLSVKEGELVVFIGRSGCGKTTVLNLLAGLVEPTKGQVRVLNMVPSAARRRMGYMFARDALLPWRTAQRNVEFALEVHGVDRDERRARAAQMLDHVGLEASRKLFPWQLSQGMRQRVALARTWVGKPDILLMDEPFAALDAQTRTSVQDQFLKVWADEGRRSIVFVTHDLAEAILLADRIVLLGTGGRILSDRHVQFERPRSLKYLTASREFQELYGELRDLIQ